MLCTIEEEGEKRRVIPSAYRSCVRDVKVVMDTKFGQKILENSEIVMTPASLPGVIWSSKVLEMHVLSPQNMSWIDIMTF